MGDIVKNRSFAAFLFSAVLIVVFLSYLPVLKSDFVLWDDDVHLLDNISIRSLDGEHLQDIFTSTVNKIYIPLTSLSFALEHHYFGYKPFVYHLDNLLLHLAVTTFVWMIGLKLGLSAGACAGAAFLFGIHPMHVESVAWVTERKDVLYAFFYLAAVVSYLYHLDKGGYRWLVLTTLLGVMSMLAKPMALSLPLILLLVDWFKGRQLSRRMFLEKVPLGLFIAGLGWVTYASHARLPAESITRSFLIWPWTFVFYWRQFVFPLFSVPVYRLPKPIALSSWEYLLSLIVFVLIVCAVIRMRKRRWLLFAFLFWFFSIFFLLRFDELKDTNIVADRFMYLPSLGFCFLIGMGLKRLWNRRPLGIFICLLLGLFLSWKTSAQCRVWKDGISLWQHQLKYYPNEHIALNNLATAVGKEDSYVQAQEEYKKIISLFRKEGKEFAGLSAAAREHIARVEYLVGLYKKAIEDNPDFIHAQYNLGELYSHVGMIPEAVEAYKRALLIDYEYKNAHFSLGNLYSKAGDVSRAIYAYDQALRFHSQDEEVYINVVQAYNDILKEEPKNEVYKEARRRALNQFAELIGRPPKAGSYFNLGVLLGESGDMDRAVSAYRRVLDINPRHTDALYNLGNIYKDGGRLAEALEMYQRIIRMDPQRSDVYLNMGIIYGRRGDLQLAREYYAKALKADAGNAKAYFNLGYIEETEGYLKKAMELYQKSAEADPKNAEGHYNLGNVYAKLKREDEAISSYLSAVKEDPEHMNAWVNLSILSFQKGDFVKAVKYCDEAVLLGYEAPQGYLDALARYRTEGSRSPH